MDIFCRPMAHYFQIGPAPQLIIKIFYLLKYLVSDHFSMTWILISMRYSIGPPCQIFLDPRLDARVHIFAVTALRRLRSAVITPGKPQYSFLQEAEWTPGPVTVHNRREFYHIWLSLRKSCIHISIVLVWFAFSSFYCLEHSA